MIAPIGQVEDTATVVGDGPILEAAKAGPWLAITITDSETGETVFP